MGTVSCLTIGAALAAAQGGETISLRPGSDCARITISKQYAAPVTVDAQGSTVRGIVVNGAANVTWRGGTVLAREGVTKGPGGYGLLIRKARSVKVTGSRFGLARKAVVVDKANDVTITGNLFEGVGEDAMIVSATSDLTITRNIIRDTIGKATRCQVAGNVIEGLSSRDCTARNGHWTDGFHADAVQLRNGVTDALIAENIVSSNMQGIGQICPGG